MGNKVATDYTDFHGFFSVIGFFFTENVASHELHELVRYYSLSLLILFLLAPQTMPKRSSGWSRMISVVHHDTLEIHFNRCYMNNRIVMRWTISLLASMRFSSPVYLLNKQAFKNLLHARLYYPVGE